MTVSAFETSNVAVVLDGEGYHALVASRLPAWMKDAPFATRSAYADSLRRHQSDKARLASYLRGLQSPEAFAAPLLQGALDKEFGPGLDVHEDQLRHVHILAAQTLSTPYQQRLTQQTLLQAALQNFEESETTYFGFDRGSQILRKTQGVLLKEFTPRVFARLCRELDLGGKYKEHIESFLLRKNASGQRDDEFRRLFMTNEISELALQADIAVMKGHIDDSAYRMLKQWVGGNASPLWSLHAVQFHEIKMLDVRIPDGGYRGALLKGVLLIRFDVPSSGESCPCVVYLSGDGEQALKQYSSLAAFEDDLRRRLRDPGYRHEFRRYLHLRSQPVFFTVLNERLNPVSGETGRRVPDEQARLQLQLARITGDPFFELYAQHTDKMLDDARLLAVSTGAEDKKTRSARWHAFLDWGVNLLFFVPGLGEAMLAVAAAQMLVQVYEGIEAWDHDDKKQAVLAFLGVVLNLELGAFIQALARNTEATAFIDSLKQVRLADGDTRLWKADLAPYRQAPALPEGLRPDASGLHTRNASTYLSLDGDYYRLSPTRVSHEYRAEHPTRTTYSPLFSHNGAGAWTHELEEPLQWDAFKLFARLGPEVADFSPEQATRIMTISGVEADQLRPVYLDQMSCPALLNDTVQRFRIDADIQRFIDTGTTNGGVVDWHIQEQLLEALWPPTRVLRFVNGEGRVLKEYGPPDKARLPVVTVTEGQIHDAELLQVVLQGLDREEVDILLGRQPGQARLTDAEQLTALNRRLADEARNQRSALFEAYYQFRSRSRNAFAALFKRDFPNLPTMIADELTDAANSYEVASLEAGRVPLRLAEESRRYAQQVRIARAYEGLFIESSVSLDADRLFLHSLENLPGWSANLRIELYEPAELAPGGRRLLDSLGPASDTPLALLRTSGGYVIEGQARPGDLQMALLQALPDNRLQALGFSRTTAPELFRQAVARRLELSRPRVRSLLDMQAIKPGFRSPMRLSDGRIGYPLGGRQGVHRVSSSHLQLLVDKLYPGQDVEVVRRFLTVEGADDGVFLRALKKQQEEYQRLKLMLEYWRLDGEYERGSSGGWLVTKAAKSRVVERIRRCWRRESPPLLDAGGQPLGHELDLSGERLLKLPELEEGSFDHVVSLKLTLVGQRDRRDLDTFLKCFTQLRELQISGGRLTRLPVGIGEMSELRRLQLNGNRIVWTVTLGQQLRSLKRLRRLNLDGNPLGMFNASGMPRLQGLQLQRTGLSIWPLGALDLLDLAVLDLQGNRLTSIPWSFYSLSSRRMRTVLLYGNPFDTQTRYAIAQFIDRPSIRFTLPEDTGVLEQGVPKLMPVVENWLNSSIPVAEQERLRNLWSLMVDEPGSQTFLESIAALRYSADYRVEYRDQLIRRVWRMIEAAVADTRLRQLLFDWTSDLETCADGFTEVFSRLGGEVLLYEAQQLADDARETAYTRLALGRSRLARLNDIAKVETASQEITRAGHIEDARTQAVATASGLGLSEAEIEAAGQVAAAAADERWPHVDEVEIYLAYRVDLAKRLALPWQPLTMLYRGASNVTRDMTREAGDRILAAENVPGRQVELLLEQPLWRDYLETLPETQRHAVVAQEQLQTLEELREALEGLARQPQASAGEIAGWTATVKQGASVLGIAEADIPVGREMDDSVYEQALEAIDRERKAGEVRITQQALERAQAPESPNP
ncbi:dermonecrotic toxin domain-containing protein [Pseudomonas gingeri]